MERLLAISDIHGNLEYFEKMLEEIKLTKEDRLVILGDMVDRGSDNMDTVFKIMDLKKQGYNIITLMGNHEDMAIEIIENYDDVDELRNGVYGNSVSKNGTMLTFMEYMRSSVEDKKRFLEEIKSYEFYYESDGYLFVHAGVEAKTPLEHQSKYDMIWIRDGFIDKESHGLPYTVIFGHTPTIHLNEDQRFHIWRKNDKIGIDCGASFGGKLACLDVLNNIEYYVR